MPRWGMVIDLDKCTACQACVVACRIENNVPFGGPEQMDMERAIFWNQFFTKVEGEYPRVRISMFPRPCQQCDDPPCVPVCPVEATYRDEDGRVLVRYEKCIGCRYCMVACPYGARYFNWFAPSFPETLANHRNPDEIRDEQGFTVGPSVRPKGIVEKCTFCVHRLERAKAENKPIGSDAQDGVVTACTQTCPAKAISFGDLDDPVSTVSELSKSRRAFRLLEDLGTHPKVYYLAEG